jgi:hypothetical protein
MMTDLRELNKNAPAVGTEDRGNTTDEAAQAHRRAERAADKAAERGIDRQRNDDQGEFDKVGPV